MTKERIQYNIRRAVPDDARNIVELISEHAKFENDSYDKQGKLEKIKNFIESKNPAVSYLVVDTEESIQGYCTFMCIYDSWYGEQIMLVDALFLREKYRGSGIGRSLLNMVKDEAKKLGLPFMRLMTPSDNYPAIRFYEREGGTSSNKLWFYFKLN